MTLQVLALELLKVLLENSGEKFRTSQKFTSAIAQYLTLSLLKNCTSTIPQVPFRPAHPTFCPSWLSTGQGLACWVQLMPATGLSCARG